jgi:hypothetical protein
MRLLVCLLCPDENRFTAPNDPVGVELMSAHLTEDHRDILDEGIE